MRKNIFIVRMFKHYDRLWREVVNSPSFEMLKTQLGTALSDLLWLTLFGVGRVD